MVRNIRCEETSHLIFSIASSPPESPTEAEYQLPHYAAVDISRRELAAPSGVRYLRKPDENEGRSHGAIGPRAFVMPLMDVDQMNLGPRFSARTHFKLPHLDSNQDKGFQRPVCCHYTMGERR